MTATMTKPSADSPEKQLMTRNEGRKLFVMGVVLITMVVYLFKSGFKTDDPNQGGVPITLPGIGMTSEPHELPTQDPVKVRDALQRSEDAKKTAAKPASEFKYDPKVLQTVIEGKEEGKGLNLVEEPALYHLAALVHGMSDEELASAHKTHGTWTWSSLRSPEGRVAARGKFRRLQGRFLIPLTQRVLETYPNEADLVWVWQGILRVQNRGYFVTITDKNFEPEIGPAGTIIEVDAAFLKGHAYESRRGIVQLPHVIVKKFHKVAPPKEWDYMNSELIWGAVVAFFVGAFLMVVYARRSRASAAQFDDWRQKRLASKKAGTPKAEAKAQEPKSEEASAAPAEAVAPGVAAPPSEAQPAESAATTEPTTEAEPPATEAEPEAPAMAAEPAAPAMAAEPAAPATEAEAETPSDAPPTEAEAEAPATEAEGTTSSGDAPSDVETPPQA
jgi:hypothetical protein